MSRLTQFQIQITPNPAPDRTFTPFIRLLDMKSLKFSAVQFLIVSVGLAFCASLSAENYEIRLEGPRIQGGLLIGTAPPGSSVLQDREPVRVSDTGVFLIGFHRDEEPQSLVQVTFPDGSTEQQILEIEQREYQVQHITGLPGRMVTPNEEDLKRIREDNAAIRKARAFDNPRTDFLDGFDWPTIGPISGVYGSARILNGEPRQPHYGIDIAVPTGTPVHAPATGIVTLVHSEMYFSGGTLILDHGHGLSSAFLHLDKILVDEDDLVSKGDMIAEVGATGRVTGAHLDWRINLFNRRIDPSLLVGSMPDE